MVRSRANKLVIFLLFFVTCIFTSNLESKAAEQVCASHILTGTRSEAVDIIGSLKRGARFEDLAREFSLGPSGPNGGELAFLEGEW